MSLGQLHALGIYSRLDQVFDAPRAVKDVLVNQFGLDLSVCYQAFYITVGCLPKKLYVNKHSVTSFSDLI